MRGMRIAHAKRLLTDRRELSIADVAVQCGFWDYNYFIAFFSREAGVSPGVWRRNCGK